MDTAHDDQVISRTTYVTVLYFGIRVPVPA